MLGKAIAKHGRSKFFLASKFGFVLEPGKGATGFDGSPAYVKKACDASLKRLGIDSIDLYYAHRVDPKTPVEETVKAMAELVKEGKVKYLGLSECSSETLRRAHKIHPISAVQSEFSLFHTTPLDNGLIETCKELGVAFVAFSPLARGFLNGKIRSPDDLGPTDFRLAIPRFSAEHFPKNLTLLAEIDKLAKEKGCTSGQLAIAWVLKQSDNIFVIPGTKRIEYLVENAGAGLVELTDEDDARLKKLLKDMPVSGDRELEVGCFDPSRLSLTRSFLNCRVWRQHYC